MIKFSIPKDKILFLDGATGTELHKNGLDDSSCPELWITQHPQVIAKIQKSYIYAGADAILVPSFGANPMKLAEFGLAEKTAELNRTLAELTLKNSNGKVFVGGDIGPSGKMIRPAGKLDFEDAVKSFKIQAEALAKAGVHFFFIETMMDIQEARAALIAVKEISDLPVIVSMTYSDNGKTLTGTPPDAAVVILQSLGAAAVGANCSLGPDSLAPIVREMRKYAKVPICVKPNAGLPKFIDGETVFNMPPDDFANFAEGLIDAGASLIGGCCGTTPEHIAKLKEKFNQRIPTPPAPQCASVIASMRKCVRFELNKPLVVVGERINPTGKKVLKEELVKGSFREVRRLAVEQETKGSDVLDLNVGAPQSDEKKNLPEAAIRLSTISSLPICLDSSNVEAIEAALRIYPGRALINSISNEKEKIEKLLPAAAKYGAMFILLPVDQGNLPQNADERIACIKKILHKAEQHGFSNDDIIIDALVMTASSNPNAPSETLKTIEWAKKHNLKTIAGISNVSFGLPARDHINAAFLSMAIARGLTAAIMNPESNEMTAAKFAADLLSARDGSCANFIEKFQNHNTLKLPQAGSSPVDNSPKQVIKNAILKGDREHIEEDIDKALSAGIEPEKIAGDLIIPAIKEVGELYDKKIYFLPQLILSAETAKKAMEKIDPLLQKTKEQKPKSKKIIIATVKGDIHDIGKNIVALMLKNHGYEVLDLGKDVPPEKIIENAKKEKADVIALSALMTTTMASMRETIRKCRLAGLDKLVYIVGGAVVDKTFADSVGAQYAEDAVGAVKVLEKILEKET